MRSNFQLATPSALWDLFCIGGTVIRCYHPMNEWKSKHNTIQTWGQVEPQLWHVHTTAASRWWQSVKSASEMDNVPRGLMLRWLWICTCRVEPEFGERSVVELVDLSANRNPLVLAVFLISFLWHIVSIWCSLLGETMHQPNYYINTCVFVLYLVGFVVFIICIRTVFRWMMGSFIPESEIQQWDCRRENDPYYDLETGQGAGLTYEPHWDTDKQQDRTLTKRM